MGCSECEESNKLFINLYNFTDMYTMALIQAVANR